MRGEKDLLPDQEINFWLSEFKKRQPFVTPGQKERLFAASLQIFCGLTDDELRAFVTQNTNKKVPVFMQAAEKVGDFWASCPLREGPEAQEEYRVKRELFRAKAGEILDGVYSREDLTRIFLPMRLGDECYVMLLILERDHFIFRRIRDAYLPKITDLLIVDRIPLGTKVTDVTDRLFPNGANPSGQIDKFMKGDLSIYTGSLN